MSARGREADVRDARTGRRLAALVPVAFETLQEIADDPNAPEFAREDARRVLAQMPGGTT